MRIGIFSDVHANIEALEAVLSELERRRVDQYVCLGDIIGYGADPVPCVDRIRALTKFTIIGNHDAAGCGRMNLDDYYPEAREAILYAWAKLDDGQRAWLTGLPYSVTDGDIFYCHGAPAAPENFEYLFSEEQADDYCHDFGVLPAVTFIGHSHLTIGFALNARQASGFIEPEVSLDRDHKYIFTAGSVGQPRDRDTRACAIVYDSDKRVVEYVRVPYAVATTQRKIREAGLPEAFASRLQFGM